ncbi:MAG: carboxypeptidase-like regulatory domain-containing protein, partial [Candidatus Zixiibacteriota bacterium]
MTLKSWRSYVRSFFGFALVSMIATSTMAGVAGKISGIVIDKESGNPLPGVTVKVAGTQIATQTDTDGEYFIINIPAGKYDVTVSSIGYETVTQEAVGVLVDLTTPVNFNLNPTTVNLQEQVVVTAKLATIQRDLTASRVIFTADRLKQLPNIVTVQSVLINYPGVIVDREDNQDLHVRGGRAGQVAYYYDGFSVQDPFVARSGIKITPAALEELSLTSGGYTAEYGEALSGVVGAVTREGGSEYSGGVRLYEGATHPYLVNDAEWAGLDRLSNRSMSFNLSGPIPGLNPQKYTFFAAGEYLHDPTYLPHNGSVSYTGT